MRQAQSKEKGTQMINMEPCPQCGSTEGRYEGPSVDGIPYDIHGEHKAECQRCGLIIFAKDALKIWNEALNKEKDMPDGTLHRRTQDEIDGAIDHLLKQMEALQRRCDEQEQALARLELNQLDLEKESQAIKEIVKPTTACDSCDSQGCQTPDCEMRKLIRELAQCCKDACEYWIEAESTDLLKAQSALKRARPYLNP